jgi:hypothetical protein
MANEYREAEEIHRAMHATLTVMGALRNHSEMAHSKWRLHKLNM